MLAEIRKATLEGYIAGLTQFAWGKDGVHYVGIGGTILADAVAAARKAYADETAEVPVDKVRGISGQISTAPNKAERQTLTQR